MVKKVYITGMGIVSSIGFNVEESLKSILEGRSGIERLRYLPTQHRGKLLTGEVKATNENLKKRLNLDEKNKYSRTTLLGLIAAREAFAQAELSAHKELKTGIISATTVGGIDQSEDFFNDYRDSNGIGDFHLISSHDCGDSTEKIADDLGIRDFITTISTACSSSANSIMLGARMIKSGRLDRVLVGGTDSLTRYTLNGFKSLKILDDHFCRPFDNTRAGLNLGEGAGFLVLESEKSIEITQKSPLGILEGYGNANDAFHQTASSPEGLGALNAMRNALKMSQLDLDSIDYVNVHGTATINNDKSEGTALKSLFQGDLPHFSSTKSFTGHTLAAAGVIEAVFSLLSINHKILIPNLNFKEPMEGLEISPVQSLEKNTVIKHILSNSFGFGGNCSSLIFGSI